MVSLLLAPAILAMETRQDPNTRRVRALLGGFPPSGWPGWAEVFTFAIEDPRIDVRAAIPHLSLDTPMVDLAFARRVARIYMPRNYGSFLDNVDFVALINIDRRIFTPENIAWFTDGVIDEGIGLLMTGGSQGFGGYGGFPSWADTVLDEVLPVYCYEGEHSKSYLPRLRVNMPDNELARSIPWEEAPCYFPYNFVSPKEGCNVIIESRDEKKTPIIFYWDVGKGRCVGEQNIFGVFGCNFMEWTYFQDHVINVYYYTVAVPLPTDILIAHELRRKWHEYRIQLKLLASLIEFADRFGANMRTVDDQMEGLRSIKATADDLYLENDHPAALRVIQEAISEARRIGHLAVRLKDQALLWVYAIESATTLGVFLLSGTLLWSLMVRKALYTEVSGTRWTNR